MAKRGGFSLIELLVSLAILGTTGLALVNISGTQVRFYRDADAQAETHQGLIAALDALTRDIRLAGACLPIQPYFAPMSGSNNGTMDAITVRTGVLSQSTTCVQAALTTALGAGVKSLSVDNTAGFLADGWGYIVGSASGEFFHVSAVSGASGPGTVTTDTTLTQGYPAGAGAYALEERAYSLDPTTYGQATLVLSINRKPAMPIATGIEALNIQYRLNQNCPNCTLIDLPTTNSTWMQASEVVLNITARSTQKLTSGGYFRESAVLAIQPRNILALRPS